MCALAREAGALGAKLTGGGGGGSVIALVPPLPNRRGPSEVAGAVLEAWRAAGFDGFVTRAGAVTAPEASGPAGGAPEATS
jgi:mevalonate kinase